MSLRRGARIFRRLSVFTGIISILVTIGLICLALVWGMMLNGNPIEIIIATWMALGLSKYLFNALLVVLGFFSLGSRAVSENYLVFLVPSVLLMVWNFAAFPHKLSYGYFLFWAVYSVFVFLNRPAGEPAGPAIEQVEEDALCRQGK